jgi:hypothetical protein
VATVGFVVSENLAIGINFKSVDAGYGEVGMPPFPDPNDYDLNDPVQQLQFIDDVTNYKAYQLNCLKPMS